MSDLIPDISIHISNPENAVEEMKSFAQGLKNSGARPWFEVRYPAPEGLSHEEKSRWLEAQEAVYDAVELIDGEIVTLPPYSELLANGEDK